MFGLRRRGPSRPFAHADNYPILKADPASRSSGRRSILGITGRSAVRVRGRPR